MADDDVLLSPKQVHQLRNLLDLMRQYTEEIASTEDPESRHRIWEKFFLAQHDVLAMLPPMPTPLDI